MNMFNIESYVTPILLSYVDKYVRDFKPADAQVTLWAGGVTLHNLVLKADVLQREVALPFTLVSGRIHELLIQVPWTKIMSEPIVVTINTIECILSLNPPADEVPPEETYSGRTQVVEAPPGYMQALVRRIVSNIAVRVHSLIVKYVHDDIVLSLNVKHLAVDSVGPNWEPTFADIDQNHPAIRRLVRLDDLTLCLDKSDSDGKIRFYHEPLLYRCQLDLRVLTRLVSASTRRARSLSVQLVSRRLAWGVNSEQLLLLLRLLRERAAPPPATPPPAPRSPSAPAPINTSSGNSAEPARAESWSEWAWSWLPTWMDREGVEEAPAPATPIPLAFAAHFDQVSLVFKIMEVEGSSRKRSRGILELMASDAVIKSSGCSPTLLRLKMGTRNLVLSSHGRCVCGHLDNNTNTEEPIIYLDKIHDPNEAPWSWVDEELSDQAVETAVAAEEEMKEITEESECIEQPTVETKEATQTQEEVDEFWQKMAPVVYLEYSHERAPSSAFTNPYDNPPRDFEYSDWVEKSSAKVTILPMVLTVSTGLLHRLAVARNVIKEVPPMTEPEIPMRTLTVEECESLSENLPQRHTNVEITGLRVRLLPSDHVERPVKPPLALDVLLPKATVLITGPLYPHRVCSAACQIPEDSGPLWQGARVHVTAYVTSLQAGICSPEDETPRPCARADVKLVTHTLLNRPFFSRRENVLFNYTVKIREASMCGSSARLQAAWQVAASVLNEKLSTPLRYTTLAKDALKDEELVAVDVTLEDLSVRGFVTKNTNTHFVTLHSARATAFHSPTDGEVKQAWLFSGPESPTATPYFRAAFQWCKDPLPSMIEYMRLLVEPTAISLDPLLVAWLGYRSRLKSPTDIQPQMSSVKTSSSQYLLRRRATPPSSSGRGASRSGSGAELVHVRPRSVESGSERSEKRDAKPSMETPNIAESWLSGDKLLKLHERLNRLLLSVEIGLVQVYAASATVSALDCATVRDAMERHAAAERPVLVLSLGRLSLYSNSQAKYLWQVIRNDQPTYFRPQRDQNVIEDSFPWKTRLADMSCYILELKTGSGREKTESGLKSQLKTSRVVLPRPVLDMVTTTVTLTVVTKCLQIKNVKKTETKVKHSEHSRDEDKTKYFTTGVDFKPSSLKEFIRGPVRRKKASPEPEEKPPEPPAFQMTITSGPVISLGVNLHADTPPVIVKLDQDQVQTVGAAIHGLVHIMKLLQRAPVSPKPGYSSIASHRNLAASVSDMDARQSLSEETASENRSEQLISIYESYRDTAVDTKLKTFFWFQWVVSHAKLVIVMPQVKLAFDVDDIISTVDLQNHYNQVKVKVASASVKHYNRSGSEEWTPGVLDGRVLEVREPANAKEENNFLAVTVTQARISNLPMSWKEELHPKLLEQNANIDTMWEVYATLAPLEMVLQPGLLEQVSCWLHELSPKHYCPITHEEQNPSEWQWPFCYVNAGGLRLLLTNGEENKDVVEDTIMFIIGKVTINPHPENPICRQSVNGATDAWNSSGPMLEGRQYEVLLNNLAVRTAQFSQLVNEEATESEMLKGTGGENPALKWSQPVVAPIITPVVHSVDVCCILAPAIYSGGAVACGPAVELNLLTDCSIELGIERLELVRTLFTGLTHASRKRSFSAYIIGDESTCPYAPFLSNQEVLDSLHTDSEAAPSEEVTKSAMEASRSMVFDSGFETATSQSTYKLHRESSGAPKKSVSIACFDHTAKPSDFLEIFVTMGAIDLSLYAGDDGSPEVTALRPPPGVYRPPDTDQPTGLKVKIEETKDTKADKSRDDGKDSMSASRSLTENIRNADIGKTKLEVYTLPYARKTEGNIPLIHVTLHQPNLYYWKKKKQKTLQVSLFNAWIGLGVGPEDGQWNAPLLSTARGSPDPVTDIPPALATLRVDLSSGGYVPVISASGRGAVQLDIERPILLEVCTDRMRRIKGIKTLIEKSSTIKRRLVENTNQIPLLYKVRHYLVSHQIESVTVQTGQIGLRGSEGAIGWSAMRLQTAAGSRPERLSCRGLVTAFLLSAGPETDRRHVVVQPLMAGALLDATWDAWRKAEGGPGAFNPTIRVGIDVDRITLDLRPSDIAIVVRIRDALRSTMEWTESPPTPESSSSASEPTNEMPGVSVGSSLFTEQSNTDINDTNNHFYKDDLRSGAFKIVSGGQLPMAYQVTLYGNTVAWRYPHPRAITRLVAFPIPDHDEEVECALELYCPMLTRWEPHTYFKLPVAEPREMHLSPATPDAVFALMWRVRACSDIEQDKANQPFEFDAKKFMPRQDPLSSEPGLASDYYKKTCAVTAEQLSGVLRVDSYFAPRHMPRARIALRLTALELHAHNELLVLPKQAKALEGYYVSRPLMRSHRILSVRVRNAAAHAVFGASSRLLLDTYLSSDILDSATGTMEQLVQEFRVQGTVSLNNEKKLRLRAGDVRVALHVPRVCTLRALATDWIDVYKAALKKYVIKKESEKLAVEALEGRVSLWVHNSCSAALRIGQEGTDELVPLSAGASLAYRWRSPTAPKKIRFALASPSADWRWSNSIAFSAGTCRVRLEEGDVSNEVKRMGGVYLYVVVKDVGSRRDMFLSGRLTLANMLRHNLLYKVRARCSEKNAWQAVSSGELHAESIGLSVLCNSECETVLKVKFTAQEIGWSGDIPLKECRKENMPWLVKVPSGGEISYTSVWCRVVRGRNDSRVAAAIWPFYILRSHLPLDADVMISSETGAATVQGVSTQTDDKVPPLVQTAPGRGSTTHLIAPGTTAATHALTFQYRNIECPVTREAVPLHYGVTDTSVFEKPTPVNNIEDIVESIKQWLDRSGRDVHPGWPYSIVTSHWPGTWQPALLQPRCDVTVRYQAVRVGGGCSLELQLCPVVLLANASPVALTLRAHDAAPLCRLEPGVGLSPPSAILQKPFFLSVEMGRETFVSGQLQVCKQEPGRYGKPGPGHVALDRAANFAIHCNQKVALLTMCYEVKEDINILGITSTYILINRLPTPILVSAMAVPNQLDKNSVLRPNMFKIVEPTKEGSLQGTPLCRFWMRGRWRGGDADELRTYLCLALPSNSYPSTSPVPVRLGTPPARRAIALRHEEGHSVAVVVTQVRHESRLVVTVAVDPCPQFVVRNRTSNALAVAQPRTEDPASHNQPVRECSGVTWWCEVEAGGTTHYSTPAHCARYPPSQQPARPSIPFLTVGHYKSDVNYDWSQPVAIADGEHLLQMSGGVTIKVRVRTHPHSTLVELQDVDQHDISASDIRRRLLGAFSNESVSFQEEVILSTVKNKVHRVSAYENLMEGSTTAGIETEEATILSPDAQLDALSASQVLQDDRQSPEYGWGGNPVVMTATDVTLKDSSMMKLSTAVRNDITESYVGEKPSMVTVAPEHSFDYSEPSRFDIEEKDWSGGSEIWREIERVRCVVGSIAVTVGASADVLPLLAVHLQRAGIRVRSDSRRLRTTISIADVQIDNAQYETEQYDFAVVAATRADVQDAERWPPLWGMFNEEFATKSADARLLLQTCHDKWTVASCSYQELTEVELRLGPLGLYVEDAYVGAAVELFHLAAPAIIPSSELVAIAESRTLQCPLRMRKLHLHPLDLTLTLHTAVRMYIALDECSLRLSAFQLQDVMTSSGRLTHALTVHYLSAAILGAGWVVGGLELLGAPGALAARVGNAVGGVRGVASAAAGALLRSLSSAAGSLARNLDLLAGDDDHARRAAAARRRAPSSLMAGLVAGITNFAINILGAVGGLAHHPLVGVAVGESGGGAAALRRGLVGAIAKPLSATADLVAYAGHGLLTQTGWNPVPQPRLDGVRLATEPVRGGWRRDCVRWSFRLAELTALAGEDALLNDAQLHLLVTHKFLVVADPESERIVEMIDFKSCTLSPYQGQVIELHVLQKKATKTSESRLPVDEDNEYQISAAAMARVARYTGAEGYVTSEARVLSLLPPPGRSSALYAALAAALQHNSDSHFPLL
ncbi:vacuolar protein sorting-associated protein 13B [Maniola jurtina]|uniref:vacuolar protein sorting-associated protein 13B n=1 Tax=Maniola jurtina TaxID=191418 RepID=UPI001E68660C|nr:vacuolar protein sorting-associated protein 13B [Maniola jurtina]